MRKIKRTYVVSAFYRVQKVDEKLSIQCYGGQIDKPTNHRQQINDNSLFIPRECCLLMPYGGRNDKVNLPDRCTKSG